MRARATGRWVFMLSLGLSVSAAAQPGEKPPDGGAADGGMAEDSQPTPPSAPTEGEAVAATPAEGDPSEGPAPAGSEPDLSAVRTELASVMDELIAARTRVAVLEKSLFRTSLDVKVVRRADDQRTSHLVLRLDGIPVHDSDGATLAAGEAQLFSGFAAPGEHELEIEIEEAAKQNATYRYARRERFRFEIKKDTRTHVEIVLRDRSDMAEELPEGDDGEYDVRTLVRIEPEEVEER